MLSHKKVKGAKSSTITVHGELHTCKMCLLLAVTCVSMIFERLLNIFPCRPTYWFWQIRSFGYPERIPVLWYSDILYVAAYFPGRTFIKWYYFHAMWPRGGLRPFDTWTSSGTHQEITPISHVYPGFICSQFMNSSSPRGDAGRPGDGPSVWISQWFFYHFIISLLCPLTRCLAQKTCGHPRRWEW